MRGVPAELNEALAAGAIDEIRAYCETDALNTYLVYLRFMRMRGWLSEAEEAAEIERALLAAAEKQRRKTEEAQRREEAQARPPERPTTPRPAAEGHGG